MGNLKKLNESQLVECCQSFGRLSVGRIVPDDTGLLVFSNPKGLIITGISCSNLVEFDGDYWSLIAGVAEDSSLVSFDSVSDCVYHSDSERIGHVKQLSTT